MPSASERIATAVTIGVAQRERTARRKSLIEDSDVRLYFGSLKSELCNLKSCDRL
jgi:hypothetical protein